MHSGQRPSRQACVTYNEFIIDNYEIKKEVMLKRSGGRTSVPQIFIDGIAIGGYVELQKLNNDGALATILRLAA